MASLFKKKTVDDFTIFDNFPSSVNDTLDEIFDESGDEEECQDIMNQVLDEISIEISGKMVRAPSAGKILPGAPPAKSNAATISDAEIERPLKALGMD